MLKAVLIHGYVTQEKTIKDVMEKLGVWDDVVTLPCHCDGGYTLHLACAGDITKDLDAADIINKIYESEDKIMPLVIQQNPGHDAVFVGKLQEPVELVSDEGCEFTFMGGVLGTYRGCDCRYQEDTCNHGV